MSDDILASKTIKDGALWWDGIRLQFCPVIPWGKTLYITFEAMADKPCALSVDINNSGPNGQNWNNNDNDDTSKREGIKNLNLTAGKWTSCKFSYSNTDIKNSNHVDLVDDSTIGLSPESHQGQDVVLSIRHMMVSYSGFEEWPPKESTRSDAGGDAMNSNLLYGISPKLLNGATKDGDVYIIPKKTDDKDHIDNLIYDLSIPKLGSNRAFHIGFSRKAVSTSTDGVEIVIRYKDDAGNINYAAVNCDNTSAFWKYFSSSITIPSGMKPDALFIGARLKTNGMRITNVTLSYDSPIALAVAEITAADVKDGKGIKSTAVTYQAAPTQTVAPTGTWSGSVPSLSESNPYLWTRTVITYTDNTTSTSYSVSSAITDPRINSTIIKHEQEYYLSTSDTSLAGGSWSTTFPARKDGTFYWVRYKDTHANNAVTYDPSANGKLLTEVNEVWNSVVSNKTAINSSNAQINMIATSVTSVKTDLGKKANSDDVKSSMDGISSTIADINKQVAELKVKANSIEASVTDVNNLAQTTQKATAALTTSGLSVDTNQTTKSVVDGTGLTITSKADNSVVAKFTTGESEIQNLKIDGYMKLGAHIVQKMQDAEWDGTIVNGTGWMWNGG